MGIMFSCLSVVAVPVYGHERCGTTQQERPQGTEQEKSYNLDSVVVKAFRPMVKVKADGGMLYDATQIMKNRPVANVLDLLEEIPGLQNTGSQINIIGTGITTIVTNGRRTQMTPEEMYTRLSSMSPSQVKSIEVYYDAPPQYGVRGGMINIVLQQHRSESLKCNGTAWTLMYHGKKYFQTGGAIANLFHKKWMWTIGLSAGFKQSDKCHDLHSIHTLDDRVADVVNITRRYVKSSATKLNTRLGYDFSKTRKLEVLYIYRTDNPDYTSVSPLRLDGATESEPVSDFDVSKHTHILQANYADKRLNIGADYVAYKENCVQDMHDGINASKLLESLAVQDVKRGDVYINNVHTIGNGQLSYGADMQWASSRNNLANRWFAMRDPEGKSQNINQHEQYHESFCGWTQKWDRLSVNAYLQLSYFHAELEQDGRKSTLWSYISVFPSATVNYKTSTNANIVFSLSTNRISPPYTVSSGRKAYFNTYVNISNSPLVEPYRSLDMHLNYVVKGRYTLGLYSTIAPHKFTQIMYQSPDELQASHQFFNLSHNEAYGMMAVVPHDWTQRITSRLTAFCQIRHLEGEFNKIKFDNENVSGRFLLTNNALLGRNKNLSIQLNAAYNTCIHTSYAIDHATFNATLAATWSPYHTCWSFIFKAADLLGTANPKRTVDYHGQRYSLKQNNDVRIASMTIRYTFNGYKQKKEKDVDVSRMGLQ